ncbi:MAG: hypothetical protein K8F30_03235 [Taibaiella sp.]|nr:hypothetical protein [Taibaiella sp.]
MKKTLNTITTGALVLFLCTGVLFACNNGSGDADNTDTTGTEYGEGAYNEGSDMDRSTTDAAGGGTTNNNNTNSRAGGNDNTGNTGSSEVNNGTFPADAGSTGAGNNTRPPEDSATRNLKKHGTIQESY